MGLSLVGISACVHECVCGLGRGQDFSAAEIGQEYMQVPSGTTALLSTLPPSTHHLPHIVGPVQWPGFGEINGLDGVGEDQFKASSWL